MLCYCIPKKSNNEKVRSEIFWKTLRCMNWFLYNLIVQKKIKLIHDIVYNLFLISLFIIFYYEIYLNS